MLPADISHNLKCSPISIVAFFVCPAAQEFPIYRLFPPVDLNILAWYISIHSQNIFKTQKEYQNRVLVFTPFTFQMNRLSRNPLGTVINTIMAGAPYK
jgi:hypothetical protein